MLERELLGANSWAPIAGRDGDAIRPENPDPETAPH